MAEIIERFWTKVSKSDGCWEWQAARDRDGYGQFGVFRRQTKAHRFSWEITNGPIPPGMIVCHTCDNPSCVRPDHLFVGTHQDNQRDKWNKGRANHHRILTEPDVIEIRELHDGGMSHRQIALRKGVSKPTICGIVKRRQWRHVK